MAPALQDTSPETLHRAHEALLRQKDLQLNFPRYELPEIPKWFVNLVHWFEKAGPAFQILYWVAGATALLVLLFFLTRFLWRLKRPEHATIQDIRSAMAEWRPTEAQAHALLADADNLAGEGEYAEAVHLLLLRSIEDLEEFRPRVVKRSYTAREIEQLSAIPHTVRTAFAGITQVVEKSRYGGYEVTALDYANCRVEYEHFAFPQSWRSG